MPLCCRWSGEPQVGMAKGRWCPKIALLEAGMDVAREAAEIPQISFLDPFLLGSFLMK